LGDAHTLYSDSRGGNDRLDGGAGDDLLVGDAIRMYNNARGGNDTLTGGTGTETFYFSDAFGDDTITDAEDGETLLVFNYAGRQADFQVTESGDRTVIAIDDNSVTLLGVTGLGGGQQADGDWIFTV
jgi:Ca2+-binding RTX toxin-like protein